MADGRLLGGSVDVAERKRLEVQRSRGCPVRESDEVGGVVQKSRSKVVMLFRSR